MRQGGAVEIAKEFFGEARSKAVEKLLKALGRHGIRVKEAHLFGSYVRGDWVKTSGVDLVIVFEDSRGLGFTKRFDLVEKL